MTVCLLVLPVGAAGENKGNVRVADPPKQPNQDKLKTQPKSRSKTQGKSRSGSKSSPVNEPVVVNKVLFHLKNEVFTLKDLRIFSSREPELLGALSAQQNQIVSKLSSADRLILFELAAREAESLELPSEFESAGGAEELHEERFKYWGMALSYLSTKQSVFQDRERFDSWFQLVKNKYDVVAKE